LRFLLRLVRLRARSFRAVILSEKGHLFPLHRLAPYPAVVRSVSQHFSRTIAFSTHRFPFWSSTYHLSRLSQLFLRDYLPLPISSPMPILQFPLGAETVPNPFLLSPPPLISGLKFFPSPDFQLYLRASPRAFFFNQKAVSFPPCVWYASTDFPSFFPPSAIFCTRH